MDDFNLCRLMALTDIRGLGSTRVIKLLNRFEHFEDIFNSEYSDFSSLSFVDQETYNEIQNVDEQTAKYKDIISRCNRSNITMISYLDEVYPEQLRELRVAPILYAKGDLSLLNTPSISIVGSRDSEKQSIDWAFETAEQLSELGYTVVSGGAKGIDTAAHEGALAGSGKTICVLGSGLNNVYPQENEELINTISTEGLVLSHRPPEQNVNRISLLDRNKITSGLSPYLLIVTSSGEGGTKSQYEDAISQNKDILCPSPSLDLEPVDGIKKIIDDGHAKTIESVSDIANIVESDNHQMTLSDL